MQLPFNKHLFNKIVVLSIIRLLPRKFWPYLMCLQSCWNLHELLITNPFMYKRWLWNLHDVLMEPKSWAVVLTNLYHCYNFNNLLIKCNRLSFPYYQIFYFYMYSIYLCLLWFWHSFVFYVSFSSPDISHRELLSIQNYCHSNNVKCNISIKCFGIVIKYNLLPTEIK